MEAAEEDPLSGTGMALFSRMGFQALGERAERSANLDVLHMTYDYINEAGRATGSRGAEQGARGSWPGGQAAYAAEAD